MAAADGKRTGGRFLGLALGVLLLMWPALVNRQPFYFFDTTSYVRAADYVANLASGGRIVTAWTARYAAPAANAARAVKPGNDVAAGNIMSGRSPYFGALLWVSYVASGFWLFVLGQAIVALLLLRATIRLFDLSPRALLPAVALLAVATGLPFYLSMLMPDALAGLGILAFLLLAIDRARLTRGERALAIAVVLASVVSHLTHIFMLVGMTGALAAAWAVRQPGVRAWPALPLGAALAVAGFASVTVTAFVVKSVFHHPPQLVPLLTSRIIEDGPGTAFIRGECRGRFVVCTMPQAAGATAIDFLWATDPRHGVFMPADPSTRARLSAEDGQFFVAAVGAHPVQAGEAMVRNSLLQMIDFRNGGINQRGWNWDALPDGERARLRTTPAGLDGWPVRVLDAIHYLAVLAGGVVAAAGLVRVARRPSDVGHDLALWVILFLVAMGINDVLGGAVSIPQYRYQARIIWLVPLLGLLAWPLLRRRHGAAA